jgi:hypothetical protein
VHVDEREWSESYEKDEQTFVPDLQMKSKKILIRSSLAFIGT